MAINNSILPSVLPVLLASDFVADNPLVQNVSQSIFSINSAIVVGVPIELGDSILVSTLPLVLATPPDPTNQTVAQSMLSDLATHNFFGESLSNTLGFTEDLTHNFEVLSVTNSLGLASVVERTTFVRLVANRVFFGGAFPPDGQSVTHNFVDLELVNAFTFSQLTGYDHDIDVTQYLGLTDRYFAPDLSNGLFSLVNINLDPISNRVGRVFLESPANAFVFVEELVRWYIATDTFAFSNIVFGSFTEDLYDDILFDSTVAAASTDFGRGPSQSVIRQTLGFTVTGKCPEKEYTPFVGDGSDEGFDPVPTTPPTLTPSTLKLTNTFTAEEITLRNPEFGNADNIRFAKIDRTTRGGDRKIYADGAWAEYRTFRLSIQNLTDCNGVTADTMIDFLNNSLGHPVVLEDWEGRQWQGLIVLPETDISSGKDGISFEIVFEGVAV